MADCEFCSGSGCVYCKTTPDHLTTGSNIPEPQAPIELATRFSRQEVFNLRFADEECCKDMVKHLNRKCTIDQHCPIARMRCDTSCPAFQEAEFYVDLDALHRPLERYRIKGFRCDSPMLVRKSNE